MPRKYGKKATEKIASTMHEFKRGKLRQRKVRLVHDVVAETPAGYRWLLPHVRGAIRTPEGFAVTNEEQWAESLAAAGA
jgi:hypothetical protein